MGYCLESLEFLVCGCFTGMTLTTYLAASLYYADAIWGAVAEGSKADSICAASECDFHPLIGQKKEWGKEQTKLEKALHG